MSRGAIHTHHDHDHDHGARRGRVVLATLVLVGIAALVIVAVRPHGKPDARHHTPTVLDHAVKSAQPVVITSAAAGAASGAPSAIDAVKHYLDAERRVDSAASYDVLSPADRAAVGSLSDWSDGARGRPHVTGYEIADTGAGSIVTNVRIDPSIDEINGVVPSSATITWATILSDDRWFVDLGHSEFAPNYPDEQGAVATALTWVAARQECSDGPQYAGNLIGQPDVAFGLCHTTGTFRAGPPEGLDTFIDPVAVTTAFGPDAPSWARVITLVGPQRLEVVTAPLGDHWVVVGVGNA